MRGFVKTGRKMKPKEKERGERNLNLLVSSVPP